MRAKENLILIIDDDFINREILKNVFCREYSFIEADNGEDGLQLALEKENILSAIFLDVNMPRMNGIEALRVLSSRGVPTRVPIFLVTAHDETDVMNEAYRLGVMDFINKPINPFVILRRVQSIVELFRAREALGKTVEEQQVELRENAATIDALHLTTIEALASAIEFRDVESGEHTNRMYDITKHILSNTEMGKGLTPDEIEYMAVGAVMHDVGKIAISDIILNKPGRLTKEEFNIMKTHTLKGAELIEKLIQTRPHPAYTYAMDIARHHHERWDGRGYPDGISGDEISIPSQVVSIADVYDALISPRVYKKAIDPDRAVEMIVGGECGCFNPKLIECFLRVEPDIRRWYQRDSGSVNSEKSDTPPTADSSPAKKEVIDVLLLMSAVESAYDMIISANLTKNTFSMVDYDRFLTHSADYDGVFDDLIESGASTVPESHRDTFIKTFSRESLLRAYEGGKKSVTLTHPQYSDDGVLHTVETTVLFARNFQGGDVTEITLAKYID